MKISEAFQVLESGERISLPNAFHYDFYGGEITTKNQFSRFYYRLAQGTYVLAEERPFQPNEYGVSNTWETVREMIVPENEVVDDIKNYEVFQ